MWHIANSSCVDVVDDFEENFFKAIITSPPYKKKDGYSDEMMAELAVALYRVTVTGGLAFINFASLAEKWGRPFDVYNLFIKANWLPVTTIAWTKSMVVPALTGPLGCSVKDAIQLLKILNNSEALLEQIEEANGPRETRHIEKTIKSLERLLEPRQIGHYTPIETETRLNNLWEYIHVFAKESLPPLDRWTPPLGVPYTDKTNLKRGKRGKRGDTHCAGNVWYIPYETRKGEKEAHAHEYPFELVKRCLTLAQVKSSDYVLEPFCGGGSTIIGTIDYGASVIGYEIDKATSERAIRRVKSSFPNIFMT